MLTLLWKDLIPTHSFGLWSQIGRCARVVAINCVSTSAIAFPAVCCRVSYSQSTHFCRLLRIAKATSWRLPFSERIFLCARGAKRAFFFRDSGVLILSTSPSGRLDELAQRRCGFSSTIGTTCCRRFFSQRKSPPTKNVRLIQSRRLRWNVRGPLDIPT